MRKILSYGIALLAVVVVFGAAIGSGASGGRGATNGGAGGDPGTGGTITINPNYTKPINENGKVQIVIP